MIVANIQSHYPGKYYPRKNRMALKKNFMLQICDSHGVKSILGVAMTRSGVASYLTYLNDMEVTVNGTSETTAIETTREADKLVIYPNPARDDLFIKSDIPIEKIEIFDMSGRTVETWRAASLQQGNSQTIHVSHLDNGIYLVRVSCSDGSVVTKKIVVKK